MSFLGAKQRSPWRQAIASKTLHVFKKKIGLAKFIFKPLNSNSK